MIRGLYAAASASISESKRVDVISNNIANVNTTGYKKDGVVTSSFPEILLQKIGGDFPDKDILKGSTSQPLTTVQEGDTYTVTAKSGFFNVQTGLGISKNRSIQFKVDDAGNLVTPQGNPILGVNGPINSGGQPITVDDKGQIMAGGTVIDKLMISNPINTIGSISYGVHVDEVFTNFAQGQLQNTGNPLDLALEGKGFMCIETPEGERYTRNGEFTRNSEGYLVTKEGNMVLGEKGTIQINGQNSSINEKGEVLVDGALVDKLKLVDFKDYELLRKEGDGLIKVADEIDVQENQIETKSILRQGYIEGSNVNSVREMVDMITMLRSFEANQKLMKAHDEMLGKSVNELGRI